MTKYSRKFRTNTQVKAAPCKNIVPLKSQRIAYKCTTPVYPLGETYTRRGDRSGEKIEARGGLSKKHINHDSIYTIGETDSSAFGALGMKD